MTAAGHELVDAHPELHPDPNPGPWDDDPCIYAGCRYGTPALALQAAWRDYITAGGMNSPDYALEAIEGGAERLVAEAHEDGWTWPGKPSTDDHRAAIDAVAETIRSEAS